MVRPRLGFDGVESSLPIYRVLIERFWGFYAPLEELLWLHDWESYTFNMEERRKSHKLQVDLRALGLSESEVSALPRCADLPDVKEWPQALGCLYVLEGATLGGQIIARQLNERWGIRAENGAAFFSSYGAELGPMWQQFRVLISLQISSDEDCVLAVTAAQQTFEKFRYWLEQKV
jgi:heme oxygenase